MARIAAIGEVMVELSPYPTAQEETREILALSFAGDTYNTSVYMARLGLETEYVTRLGDDPYSDQMIETMHAEGVGTGMIERAPGRTPGLYIIHNTPDGERAFFYWRGESPARELFADPNENLRLYRQLESVDAIYLSGITLAILSESARQSLLDALEKLRAKGIKIVFDSNYRPRLWQSSGQAQQALGAVLEHCDIALLTLDDEQQLWGDASAEQTRKRYPSLPELVIKRGADDTIVIAEGQSQTVPVPPVENVVDTTAAGDTFNAGYLAARLRGATPTESAVEGTRCARLAIQHRGAIIEKTLFEAGLAE